MGFFDVGLTLYKCYTIVLCLLGLYYTQSGVAELIMRDPHCGRMYFKSVETLGVLHS